MSVSAERRLALSCRAAGTHRPPMRAAQDSRTPQTSRAMSHDQLGGQFDEQGPTGVPEGGSAAPEAGGRRSSGSHDTAARNSGSHDAPARSSGPHDAPRRSGPTPRPRHLPRESLIVAIPAHHEIAMDRVAERKPRISGETLDVIVACAGQPTHTTVTAVHARLRTAQFMLAPAETTEGDLRALAMSQATGDVVTLVGHTAANVQVSVVVPVRNSAATLGDALAAIVESDLPRDRYELIVVDDASDDASVAVAAHHADTIVRLKGPARGAAYARNRGADQARGSVLVFLDADVRVRKDTLTRLLGAFEADPDLGAVGASSDGASADGGVPTQYWDLLQQYATQHHSGTGIHFEASRSAVHRDAFYAAGMFDEWRYGRASVEDLELGLRLHRIGRGVRVLKDVAVSHLRAHSLLDVLRAVWRRSSLLTRTLSYRATRPVARANVVHTLNSALGFAACAAAALVLIAVFVESTLAVALAVLAVVALLAANFRVYRFFAKRRGLTFAVAAAPLHILVQIVATLGRCSGWVLRNAIGDPSPDATTQAFAEVGLEMWPPVPRKQ